MPFDHALFIGFGGPTRSEEVGPFLRRIGQGALIPEERLREVESHYKMIGGASPYNDHAARLVSAVRRRMKVAGVEIPLFLGMRNWHPFLTEIIPQIEKKGLKQGLAVVLAPHRAEASFERYLRALQEACKESEAQIAYEPLPPWHEHPLFIGALVERTGTAWQGERGWQVLFTAHSLPTEMPGASAYQTQVDATARQVVKQLGIQDWGVAYQSRSGTPGEKWLGPDVREKIAGLKALGRRGVTVVPVGFLFDHAEVLYDLDVEARQIAEAAGLEFRRASTVMDHSSFVQMFAELIQAQNPVQGAKR